MKKENAKFVEEKIKEYFNTEEKITLIKNIIISLEEKISLLEDKNRNLKLDFDIDVKSTNVDNTPKSSSDGTSYFERNIIKQIEYNEKMIENIKEEIEIQENQIFNLEIKNSKMKNIINIFGENYRNILYFRYKENMSEVEISLKLNLSTSQYHRNKKEILRVIYNILVIHREIL